MQHWVAVHKFECHQLKPGSPGSLDADGGTVTSEVVLSPGSSGSENHKGFANFIGTSSVNGVGPPVPMCYLGHTIPSRLPSSIVLSDGQQSKPKKVCRNMQVHHIGVILSFHPVHFILDSLNGVEWYLLLGTNTIMESDGSVLEGFLYNWVIFWVFVAVFERFNAVFAYSF